MHSDLRDVVVAIDLSRVIFQRIQLNMLFSLVFNCLGIPIAAGALYPANRRRLPPEVAGLAMALSSVCVVVSSLLLRRYAPPNLPILPELEGNGNATGSSSSAPGTTNALLDTAGPPSERPRAPTNVEAFMERSSAVSKPKRGSMEPMEVEVEMKTQLTSF
jgi:hypothetical protein